MPMNVADLIKAVLALRLKREKKHYRGVKSASFDLKIATATFIVKSCNLFESLKLRRK